MTDVGYQAPRCTCGHPTGSHLSAGTSWPHPPSYGRCTITDCPCTQYTRDSSRKEPQHDQAAHHPGDTRGDRRDGPADVRRGVDHDRHDREAGADPDADAGPGTAQPVLLGLAHTRVRALLTGLASGGALGALTALLTQAVAS